MKDVYGITDTSTGGSREILYPSNIVSLKDGNCIPRKDPGANTDFEDAVGPTGHGSLVIDNDGNRDISIPSIPWSSWVFWQSVKELLHITGKKFTAVSLSMLLSSLALIDGGALWDGCSRRS